MIRGKSWAGALSLFLVGCTSNGYAPLNDARSFVATDGIVTLDDEHGTTLPVTPDSRVSFETEHGWTAPVTAGDLCRTELDFAVRVGETCAGATPLVPYSEIKGVEVDTMDRAGTVAIVSAVSAVVLAVLAAVVFASKGSTNTSTSGGSSSAAGGGGHHPHVGTYDGSGVSFAARTLVAVTPVPSEDLPDPALPPRDAGIGRSFTAREVRRAGLSVLASADVTASAFSREGLSSGIHGGLRVNDFVDVQIGARFLEGGSSVGSARAVPTAKLGLHGEFPRARWLALGLSFEGGHGAAVDLYLDARFGLRFEPVRGLWLGLYPFHPSYVGWSHGRGEHWVPQSSLDLAFGF